MLIIGHRGSAGTSPENTLKSFEEAVLSGADAFELDVQVCKTGELVVIHDRWVDRTTNGHGLVLNLSFSELRSLDAGDGEKIPTLEEVFELTANRVEIHVELKSAGTSQKAAELINRFVADGKYTFDRFLVSSFNQNELLNFRKYNKKCRIAALMAHTPVNYADCLDRSTLDLWSLNLDIDNTNPEFVMSAHKKGYRFLVYTVNDLEDRELLREMGVDGVFTNFPNNFVAL
ncbi:putative glcerophosphoryl diester phosphodiesterase [Desulfamplus magnetovallimortis]|uniref:Putative glcerophosphoryl diester phosphodiesterase n=1 Tax=Desulfamplus magnetovallimortis TaxID=1246637 RepID=A0A1W1HAZ0_9BACT|nr:glycerophosphodiester phosphodiesterase family protein [Desulfamplus magnetovallimortis]SLM29603.1 putative glcerophosphoryl diester phosphodiesterase [Desulfamplus magnetovallimortis]